MIPTSIDGTDITGATIDGQDVQEITVDGNTVFTAEPQIPDPGDLVAHYDFSQETGTTTVTDLSGNGNDLSGSYSGQGVTINGVQAGDFDGSSDTVAGSFGPHAQPNTVAAVIEFRRINTSRDSIIDSNGTNEQRFGELSGDYFMFSGVDFDTTINSSTSPTIFNLLFDGSSSILRANGVQQTGNAGNQGSADGFRIGRRNNTTFQFADAKVGEILYYDSDKSGIFTDIEDYFSSKWGITI